MKYQDDFLYHGTTLEYFERKIEEQGMYKHDRGLIFLTYDHSHAWRFAKANSFHYKATPLLLIVEAEKITSDETMGILPLADSLNPKWLKKCIGNLDPSGNDIKTKIEELQKEFPLNKLINA